MRRIFDKDEAKIVWGLDTWYEKTVFVFGVIYTVLFMIGFIYGFVSGLSQ